MPTINLDSSVSTPTNSVLPAFYETSVEYGAEVATPVISPSTALEVTTLTQNLTVSLGGSPNSAFNVVLPKVDTVVSNMPLLPELIRIITS